MITQTIHQCSRYIYCYLNAQCLIFCSTFSPQVTTLVSLLNLVNPTKQYFYFWYVAFSVFVVYLMLMLFNRQNIMKCFHLPMVLKMDKMEILIHSYYLW